MNEPQREALGERTERAHGVGERWRAALELALVLGAATLFASRNVQHLTNGWYGDVEFSGWSSGPAQQLWEGRRAYEDAVLPIPPGSFYLLMLLRWWRGEWLLSSELWLTAGCQVGMGLAAWWLTRRLGQPRLAPLVALGSQVVVMQLAKECAYDPTAQVVAWASLAVGASAALATQPRQARWRWAWVGLLTGLSHLFKQSTGVGLSLGWVAALGYGAFVAWRSGAAPQRRLLRCAVEAWGLGWLAGLGLTLLAVALPGGSLSGFLAAVYRDGPRLKGGSLHLLEVLWGYVVRLPALPASLLALLLLGYVGRRWLSRPGAAQLGVEFAGERRLTRGGTLLVAVAALVSFGGAWALLLSPLTALPAPLSAALSGVKVLPSLALPLGMVFFAAPLAPRVFRGAPGDEQRRVGHAHNMVVIAAVACSLLHNTSAPELRAFYDNTPLVALALLWGLTALRRARSPWLGAAFFSLVLASGYSGKFERALEARRLVEEPGYWRGLYVTARAQTQLRAAALVREHSAPTDTVLVLPEDVELAPLLGRPRPRLRGAILFVDQYPESVLEDDRRELERHPPKVIVVSPVERWVWQHLFRIWSAESPAERLLTPLLDALPSRYERVGRLPTWFLGRPTHLEVWVRRPEPGR